MVARLRKAGAIVVGIARAPELCLYASTDGPGRGHAATRGTPPGRRPAAPGGSAAAVASGSVPLAHGNDGMGSLRLPAAACGLVTLKPGRGVVPAEIGADSWSGMAENGALATTVADLAVAHAVMAGEEPRAAPGARPAAAHRAVHPLAGARGAGGRGRRRAAVDAVVAAADRGRAHRRPEGPADHARRGRRCDDPLDGSARRTTRSTLGSTGRRCSRAAARTPGSAGWSTDGARPAADRRALPGADGRLLRGRRRAAHPVTTGPAAAGPAVARAVVPGEHHGQRPLGALDRGLEPGGPAGDGRPGRESGRRGCRWRSSSSAPRVPKGDYSGWPESWSVSSRGAATRPSSTPRPRRPRRPSESLVHAGGAPSRRRDRRDTGARRGGGNSSPIRGLGLE